MKTVINAKIIFETDKYDGLYWTGNNSKMLTMQAISDILSSGEYELVEVLRNELMNNQEIILVIKQK